MKNVVFNVFLNVKKIRVLVFFFMIYIIYCLLQLSRSDIYLFIHFNMIQTLYLFVCM